MICLWDFPLVPRGVPARFKEGSLNWLFFGPSRPVVRSFSMSSFCLSFFLPCFFFKTFFLGFLSKSKMFRSTVKSHQDLGLPNLKKPLLSTEIGQARARVGAKKAAELVSL